MTTRTDFAVCMLCEATCGITVEHDGVRVARVTGDERDPFSRGHICPKGAALADLQNDPDRLRRPLRRRGSDWEEVSWETALDEAAARLHEVQQRHGRDALAVYTGNPTSHSYAAVLFDGFLKDTIASRSYYSATSVDALPLVLANAQMFGNQAVVPVPDIDRTDFLLILGANPVVSNGSAMTAPDVSRRLRAIRERGGRVVLVDPRRSETAALADRHHFVRPGTDALLLAAMLHTLFAEDRARPGRVAAWIDGWDAIPDLLTPFTPKRVAPVCGIDADEIEGLAREFAAAPSAACYGRMGTSVQDFALLSTWLIHVLNIATGNLDREGGVMFATPAADLPRVAQMIGQIGDFGRWKSRVSGLPEFNGELPVATFAEEIETPGPGQIRALVTNSGNPVLSLPNGRRLSRAFEGLEFMLSIDVYLNETTRHAHLILPPTFGLERDHYSLIQHGTGVRNTAHYAPALLAGEEGALADWEVMLELTRRLARERGGLEAVKGRLRHAIGRGLGPRGALALLLRMGPHAVTLKQLERSPHGIDLGPLEPRLPGVLPKGRRIDAAPAPMRADLPRLERALDAGHPQGANGLVLVSQRSARSNNSWMHNSERLVKGRDRCVLRMNPDDAERRGLRTGQRVVLKSKVGEIELALEVTEEMMPGVVSMPHGWGHDRDGSRLRVAATRPGASVNDVTDDGRFDPACGVSSLSGVPVTVVALSA